MGTTQIGTSFEHRIGPRGRFVLRLASGEIKIRGVEGDTARVRSLDEESIGTQFTVTSGDDFLELRQSKKVGGFLSSLGIDIVTNQGGSAELEIEVPHGATVSIESASAEIEASDLSGEKSFRSASGDVELRRLAGSVSVETVSGDIDIDGNAPISLTGKSVSGDIQVRVPQLRELDMGTTSGDIRIDAALTGNGAFALRSISGDAMIVGRSSFRVEAETITGDLSSDVPAKQESMPGRRVLTIGRNGPTLRYRSVSGDLRVTQPRDAAPTITGGPDVEIPQPPAPPAAPAAPEAQADIEARRLEILRQLERGDISIADATDQLSQLEGPAR